MKVVSNMAELIGETPLVRLNRITNPNGATVYLKMEMQNPSGSVKDRAACQMIVEAEQNGHLKPGSTIIEPTSGNTGIGLAMNAAARGYRAIIVMPDTMSKERINLLKAYGAEVILTEGDKKMPGAIDKAYKLHNEIKDSFLPMQFENEANPNAHRQTTAIEIKEAMDELQKPLSAFIAASGTGGTITGTGEELKKFYPKCTVHVVEPAGSPVLSGGRPGPHKLVGTSPGFIPPILNQNVYDDIFKIEDEDAYQTTRELAKKEGILVGPSSGAACFAAMRVAEKLSPDEIVVAIACDTGERYLSTDLFDFEQE
ncbi:cysteine synthase [Alkalihalobacillus alcalophilus ATCC 27647 = CGMCC 1.3604]|uniref:Cysteine synthase n=1 Tax=Alkalihalobacillus alcalophilus ATCC 27647 = CGMCC 1.3604 TaxID=1218173 RepID=A0A094YZ14_ALKAL|nr:cysteine synthase A [Alkalihalobacillus alcalophilus]KGA98762.1 cysteine synthase [Alkalihalobacillus alcalophilus ATCC 27647 = CGMCC 1.3604]MED1560942.1 cysteine synthase A [Alkalihalobacillus alcalophilus]THG92170.1 cysteine synthase [Alkalihalobacillus alcalophilus ATCC 27647 = CGMCC 1.3604]